MLSALRSRLGALGSARAGAGVLAFLIGGILGSSIGWRPSFGILIVLAANLLGDAVRDVLDPRLQQ